MKYIICTRQPWMHCTWPSHICSHVLTGMAGQSVCPRASCFAHSSMVSRTCANVLSLTRCICRVHLLHMRRTDRALPKLMSAACCCLSSFVDPLPSWSVGQVEHCLRLAHRTPTHGPALPIATVPSCSCACISPFTQDISILRVLFAEAACRYHRGRGQGQACKPRTALPPTGRSYEPRDVQNARVLPYTSRHAVVPLTTGDACTRALLLHPSLCVDIPTGSARARGRCACGQHAITVSSGRTRGCRAGNRVSLFLPGVTPGLRTGCQGGLSATRVRNTRI